jgi:cell division protein FtsQ
MTKRAARSTSTRRPGPKKRPQQRRPKRPSALDRAIAALPFSEATLRRIATWGIVGAVGAVALGVAGWFGVPTLVGVAASEAIGEAGFRLDKIDISGLRRMDRNTVYAQALDQKSRAMPLIDLAGVRQRLLQYSWIEDARVSRRLPDTLVIHIVERIPAAVWQNQGRLMLVDTKGVELEPVSREAMPDLPLLIGEGANKQEDARRRLMEAAPALKPLVKAATWVGNRRWDLIFDTGEKVQLPEGEEDAAKALVDFAQRDANSRLLGRGFVSFDMRDQRNMIVRRRAPAATPSASPVISQGQE